MNKNEYYRFDGNLNEKIAIDKENGGVSTARNLGIKTARGKYLVFVDPDDRLESEYLKTLFDSIDKSNLY